MLCGQPGMLYCPAHDHLQLSYRLLMMSGHDNAVSDLAAELQGLRDLDPKTVSAVHDRYFPEVYRYARFRMTDARQAEDLASDVFVRLLEAIQAGRPPHTHLRGWLMRTASNLIADHFRKQYRQPTEALSDEIEAANADPDQHAEKHEQQRTVRKMVNKLTPEQQHVIALRFGSGFSLEQTANALGKNANAVKALQFRALEALRSLTAEDLE